MLAVPSGGIGEVSCWRVLCLGGILYASSVLNHTEMETAAAVEVLLEVSVVMHSTCGNGSEGLGSVSRETNRPKDYFCSILLK